MMESDFHTIRGYETKKDANKKITSTMEDYIEMIYRHSLKENYIRINELANLLNVKDSSASKMIQKLALLGIVNYEKYGIITLTKEGIKLGKYFLERHNIIEQFLKFLNCNDVLKQTELIEHVLNRETVTNLDLLTKFFNENNDILKKYENFKNNNV